MLEGAAATAARWPEIGQPAEQNVGWTWLLGARGCTHACRAWGLLGPGMNSVPGKEALMSRSTLGSMAQTKYLIHVFSKHPAFFFFPLPGYSEESHLTRGSGIT